MGNQQTLTGEFIGSWFAWDGVRALDYLLTREEVDPKHVGITGNSGGGTRNDLALPDLNPAGPWRRPPVL